MNIKKTLTMMLAGALALVLFAGCQQKNNETSQTDNDQTQENQQTQTTDTDTLKTSGNTLVVYYSATGNTEDAAKMIAEETDGTLFEIEPKEPYSDADLNWTDENSRVTREHENENERDVELVSTEVENWDSYDTVFIGYPIWWGIAAWPVDNFVKNNDFTDKTVIPFCTSASSGLGQSGDLLAQMAGTGNWQEGHRFRSSVSSSEVQEWLIEIGIIK